MNQPRDVVAAVVLELPLSRRSRRHGPSVARGVLLIKLGTPFLESLFLRIFDFARIEFYNSGHL